MYFLLLGARKYFSVPVSSNSLYLEVKNETVRQYCGKIDFGPWLLGFCQDRGCWDFVMREGLAHSHYPSSSSPPLVPVRGNLNTKAYKDILYHYVLLISWNSLEKDHIRVLWSGVHIHLTLFFGNLIFWRRGMNCQFSWTRILQKAGL